LALIGLAIGFYLLLIIISRLITKNEMAHLPVIGKWL